MSAIEINGIQKNEATDRQVRSVSGIEPIKRRSPADASTVEKFSNAVNRRSPLPFDADLREDRLFDLLAQLDWPGSGEQIQAQPVNDAPALPGPAAGSEMRFVATPVLLADLGPALAQTMHGQHMPAQDYFSDNGPQTLGTLSAEREINRTVNAADGDQASDSLQAVAQFTLQVSATADSNAAQPVHVDRGMTEVRMQEFQHLISQMGAQLGIDSRRSEVAISLSHAMFSSTRLKIRGDKDSIQVDYECGTAEEADWFGTNAEALVQRLSATLQRHVSIRPIADHLEA